MTAVVSRRWSAQVGVLCTRSVPARRRLTSPPGKLDAVELRNLAAQVELISRRHASTFGINRTKEWFLLKLYEGVGELTQVHLMREGQARPKGRTVPELDALFAAEIADAVCQALLIAEHHGVDVETAIAEKWLSRL